MKIATITVEYLDKRDLNLAIDRLSRLLNNDNEMGFTFSEGKKAKLHCYIGYDNPTTDDIQEINGVKCYVFQSKLNKP